MLYEEIGSRERYVTRGREKKVVGREDDLPVAGR